MLLIAVPFSNILRLLARDSGRIPEVDSAVRVLRTVQVALLVSILLCLVLAMRLPTPTLAGTAPVTLAALGFLSVMNVGIIFVLRRVFVRRSAVMLGNNPEDPLALMQWRAGHIATYAVAESIAVFGLILRFVGFTLPQVGPFFLAGFVLLLFLGPRRPVNAIG